MSLAINVDDVVAVLLTDGWYEVYGRSFDIDTYEYTAGEGRLISFDPESGVGVTYLGFVFTNSDGDRVAGPMTAIQAVRVRESL